MANDSPHDPGTAPPKAQQLVSQVVLNAQQMRRALVRIAHEIVERNEDLASLYLVGVPNGGVPLARQLAANLTEIADLEPVVATRWSTC